MPTPNPDNPNGLYDPQYDLGGSGVALVKNPAYQDFVNQVKAGNYNASPSSPTALPDTQAQNPANVPAPAAPDNQIKIGAPLFQTGAGYITADKTDIPLYNDVGRGVASTVGSIPYVYAGQDKVTLQDKILPVVNKIPQDFAPGIKENDPVYYYPEANTFTGVKTDYPVYMGQNGWTLLQNQDAGNPYPQAQYHNVTIPQAPDDRNTSASSTYLNKPGVVETVGRNPGSLQPADLNFPTIKQPLDVFGVGMARMGEAFQVAVNDLIATTLVRTGTANIFSAALNYVKTAYYNLASIGAGSKSSYSQFPGLDKAMSGLDNGLPIGSQIKLTPDMIIAHDDTTFDQILQHTIQSQASLEEKQRKSSELLGKVGATAIFDVFVPQVAPVIAPLQLGAMILATQTYEPLISINGQVYKPVDPTTGGTLSLDDLVSYRQQNKDIQLLTPQMYAADMARRSWQATKDNLVAFSQTQDRLHPASVPPEWKGSANWKPDYIQQHDDLVARSKSMKEEAFRYRSLGDMNRAENTLVRALQLDQEAGGLLGGTLDPATSLTMISKPEVQKQFTKAMAQAELQLGRELSPDEIFLLQNNFNDPLLELVGSMVLDWTHAVTHPAGTALSKAVGEGATKLSNYAKFSYGGFVKKVVYETPAPRPVEAHVTEAQVAAPPDPRVHQMAEISQQMAMNDLQLREMVDGDPAKFNLQQEQRRLANQFQQINTHYTLDRATRNATTPAQEHVLPQTEPARDMTDPREQVINHTNQQIDANNLRLREMVDGDPAKYNLQQENQRLMAEVQDLQSQIQADRTAGPVNPTLDQTQARVTQPDTRQAELQAARDRVIQLEGEVHNAPADSPQRAKLQAEHLAAVDHVRVLEETIRAQDYAREHGVPEGELKSHVVYDFADRTVNPNEVVLAHGKYVPVIGNIIQFLSKDALRSVASKLSYSAFEMFNDHAKIARDYNSFVHNVAEMGDALRNGVQVDENGVARLYATPDGMSIRGSSEAIRLADALSDKLMYRKITPQNWGQLVEEVHQQVYQLKYEEAKSRGLEMGLTDAENEARANQIAKAFADDPNHLVNPLSARFKADFLRANTVRGLNIPVDSLWYKATSVLSPTNRRLALSMISWWDGNIYKTWLKFVLSFRPAWVARNYLDTAFRYIIFGGGYGDAWTRVRDLPEIMNTDYLRRVHEELGEINPELSTTFVGAEEDSHVRTVSEEILDHGWKPRSILDYFTRRYRLERGEKLTEVLSRNTSPVGQLLLKLGDVVTHPQADWRSWYKGLGDLNQAIEFAFRTRMFHNLYETNISRLNAEAWKIVETNPDRFGITPATHDLVRNLFSTVRDPVQLRNIAESYRTGNTDSAAVLASLLMPGDLDRRLGNFSVADRNAILTHLYTELQNFVEEQRMNGGTFDHAAVDAFITRMNADVEQKRAASLNHPDLRDRPDPNGVAEHQADTAPAPAPGAGADPSNPTPTTINDVLIPHQEAIDRVAPARTPEQIVSTLRDGLHMPIVAAPEGVTEPIRVVRDAQGVRIEVSGTFADLTTEQAKARMADILTQLQFLRNEQTALAGHLFADSRDFGEGLRKMVTDPTSLYETNRSQFDYLANILDHDGSFRNALARMMGVDPLELRYGDHLTRADEAEHTAFQNGGGLEEEYIASPPEVRIAGTEAARVRANYETVVGNLINTGRQQEVQFLQATSHYLDLTRSQLRQFMVHWLPGPLRYGMGALRSAVWDTFWALTTQMYERNVSRLNRTTEALLRGEEPVYRMSLKDHMDDMGLHVDWDQNGNPTVLRFVLQTEGGRVTPPPLRMSRGIREFFENMFGQNIWDANVRQGKTIREIYENEVYTDALRSHFSGMPDDYRIQAFARSISDARVMSDLRAQAHTAYEGHDIMTPAQIDDAMNIYFAEMHQGATWAGVSFTDFMNMYQPTFAYEDNIPTVRYAADGVTYRQQEYRAKWYTRAEQLLPAIPNKIKAGDLRNYLLGKGVKPVEMRWTGLDDWLGADPNRVLTKDEIIQQIQDGQVMILPKEVVQGDTRTLEEVRRTEVLRQRRSQIEDEYLTAKWNILPDNYDEAEYNATLKRLDAERDQIDAELRPLMAQQDVGFYSEYVLPGEHSHYQERLLVLPSERATRQAKIEKDLNQARADFERSNALPSDQRKPEIENAITDRYLDALHQSLTFERRPDLDFKSNHWSQSNIVLHTRSTDRVDVQNRSVKMMEEVQSDMNQQGREFGYRTTEEERAASQRIMELEKQINDSFQEEREAENQLPNLEMYRQMVDERNRLDIQISNMEQNGENQGGYYDFLVHNRDELTKSIERGSQDRTLARNNAQQFATKRDALRDEIDSIKKELPVAQNPWMKTEHWTQLGIKDLLYQAALEGKDVFAWTTGDQQVARYGMDKHIQHVEITRNADGTYNAWAVLKSGTSRLMFSGLAEKRLDENLGHRMAQDARDYFADGGELYRIDQFKLEAALRGMRDFYDTFVTGEVGKLVKKWGIKTTTVDIPTPDTYYKEKDMRFWDEREAKAYLNEDLGDVKDDYKIIQDQPNSSYRVVPKNRTDHQTVHAIELTPQMRDEILNGGQPLFQTKEPTYPVLAQKDANFQQWFGGSKLTQPDGLPQTFYHGTAHGGFSEFSTEHQANPEALRMGPGWYFSDKPDVAQTYTTIHGAGERPQVYPVHIAMKNPLDMVKNEPLPHGFMAKWNQILKDHGYKELPFGTARTTEMSPLELYATAQRYQQIPKAEIAKLLQEAGFDGILYRDFNRASVAGDPNAYHTVAVVWDKNAIKSVDNTGLYGLKTGDIYNQTKEPTAPIGWNHRMMNEEQLDGVTRALGKIITEQSPEAAQKTIKNIDNPYEQRRVLDRLAQLDPAAHEKYMTWDQAQPHAPLPQMDAQGQIVQGQMYSPHPRDYQITLTKDANVTSLSHELTHAFIETLRDVAQVDPAVQGELDALLRLSGQTTWNVDAHEYVARSFEKFLRDGISPGSDYDALFGRMRGYFQDVYRTIPAGSDLDKNLDRVDQTTGLTMRQLFNRWFGATEIEQNAPSRLSEEAMNTLGWTINLDGTRIRKQTVPLTPEQEAGVWDAAAQLYGEVGELQDAINAQHQLAADAPRRIDPNILHADEVRLTSLQNMLQKITLLTHDEHLPPLQEGATRQVYLAPTSEMRNVVEHGLPQGAHTESYTNPAEAIYHDPAHPDQVAYVFDNGQLVGVVHPERAWVAPTPDEVAQLDAIRSRMQIAQTRAQVRRDWSRNLSRMNEYKPREAAVLRQEAGEMLMDLYRFERDPSTVTSGTSWKANIIKDYAWMRDIVRLLPDENPRLALTKAIEDVITGRPIADARLGQAIRKAMLDNLENGVQLPGRTDMVRNPHPYYWEAVGDANRVREAREMWSTSGRPDPTADIDTIVQSHANRQAFWQAFIQQPWYGDMTLGRMWGNLAQTPEYFTAYLRDLYAHLDSQHALDQSSREALQLLMWQVENFNAMSQNFAESLGMLRHNHIVDGLGTVPLSTPITALPEGHQQWFYANANGLAQYAQMKEAIAAWKDLLHSKLDSGYNPNLSLEDTQKLIDTIRQISDLKQNGMDLAARGLPDTFRKYAEDILGTELNGGMTAKLYNGKEVPLSNAEKNALLTLESNYKRLKELADKVPDLKGAIPETSYRNIDYADYSKLDETMKGIIPFWMFFSRSTPMWLSAFATHPEIVGFYAKYLLYAKRLALQSGATTTNGDSLPSLDGYIPIPGTDLWFNPLAAMSFRFAIPNVRSYYSDESNGQDSILQVVAGYLNDFANTYGFGLHPWITTMTNVMFPGKFPTNALIPQMELVPRWWRNSILEGARRVSGGRFEWLFGDQVPWQDYLIERRLLADALAQMQGKSQTERNDIAQKAYQSLLNRENDKQWNDTSRELQNSELWRQYAGYFSGFYTKPLTDSEIQLMGLRDEINSLKDQVNNVVNAKIFGADPDAKLRYQKYVDARYNVPSGYLYNLYNLIRYVQAPDGTALTGSARRDAISQSIHEDLLTQSYQQLLKTLNDDFASTMRSFPIGTPYNQKSDQIDAYFKALNKLETDPLYTQARRTWQLGNKPDMQVIDYFRNLWFRNLYMSEPRYDPKVEDYPTFLKRQEEWYLSIPNLVQSMTNGFLDTVQKRVGVGIDTHVRNNQGIIPVSTDLPLPNAGKDLELANIVAQLQRETTPANYLQWKMSNDTPTQAMDAAWTAMYWDKYQAAVAGKSGMDREVASRTFLNDNPPPSTQDLVNWVKEHYPQGQYTDQDLVTATQDRSVLSVTDRLTPQTEQAKMEQEIWDTLLMAGPTTTNLIKAYQKNGGDPSDFDIWYGAGTFRDPNRFKNFHDSLMLLRQEMNLTDPSMSTLKEWDQAQTLNKQLKVAMEEQFGQNISQVMSEYYAATSSVRRQMRAQNPNITNYFNARDAFAAMHPEWQKYYYPTYKGGTGTASTGTATGTGTGTGTGYSTGTGTGKASTSPAALNGLPSGGSWHKNPDGSYTYTYTPPNYVALGYRATINPKKMTPEMIGKGGAGGKMTVTVIIPPKLTKAAGPVLTQKVLDAITNLKPLAPTDTKYLGDLLSRHPEWTPWLERALPPTGVPQMTFPVK